MKPLKWSTPIDTEGNLYIETACNRYMVSANRVGDLHAYTAWRQGRPPVILHTETNLTTADRPAALARCKAAAQGDAT